MEVESLKMWARVIVVQNQGTAIMILTNNPWPETARSQMLRQIHFGVCQLPVEGIQVKPRSEVIL